MFTLDLMKWWVMVSPKSWESYGAEKLINKTRIWPLPKLINERNLHAQNSVLLRRNRHMNLSCFTPFSFFSLRIPKRNIFWRVTERISIFNLKLSFLYFICCCFCFFFFLPKGLNCSKINSRSIYIYEKQYLDFGILI